MTLLRYYNPEFRFNSFSKVLDQLNADVAPSKDRKLFRPEIDIAETDKTFTINLSVPGIKKEDIKIELEDDKLSVSGERKVVEGDVTITFHKQQTAFGRFHESFNLPENANKESVTAKHEDGILSISIEKIEKKLNKSVIEVK